MGDFYESDRAVSEYLFFHYGDPGRLLPWDFGPGNGLNYPVRCVSQLLDRSSLPPGACALDLGCAVGRSTFELARHCEAVLGIDYSKRFVEEAEKLAKSGHADYRYVTEGEITEAGRAKVDAAIDRRRVTFEQGDACRLRTDLGDFDIVLMANLLCRLPDPEAALLQLPGMIRKGGQLLITTPCSWMEEYTPKNRWLGGVRRDGTEIRTLDSLRALLAGSFELELRCDMPFLIREHERKFQWTVAEGTRWRRR